MKDAFREYFGKEPEYLFTAPGRVEISGNHTDHQHGRVMAAAVDLDAKALAAYNGTDEIRLFSEGYGESVVNVNDLEIRQEDKGTFPALVRGVAYRFSKLGAVLKGIDVYVRSTVLNGSGLSSSAAFEVLIGTMLNYLFYDSKAAPVEIAQIGQFAENVYYGKPCGLMDQTASSVGNVITIDFRDTEHPVVERIDFDFAQSGYELCVIDSGADHADLTDEYASITTELKNVCHVFGREFLRDVDEDEFYSRLPEVRKLCGDRAALRAIHVFNENRRVAIQTDALKRGDFDTFLEYVTLSGRSSWDYLQNVIPTGASVHQGTAVALALCRKYLKGRGGARVNGGGFAGTVLAFVPTDMLDEFRTGMEAALGKGSCHVLSIRPQGGTGEKLK